MSGTVPRSNSMYEGRFLEKVSRLVGIIIAFCGLLCGHVQRGIEVRAGDVTLPLRRAQVRKVASFPAFCSVVTCSHSMASVRPTGSEDEQGVSLPAASAVASSGHRIMHIPAAILLHYAAKVFLAK